MDIACNERVAFKHPPFNDSVRVYIQQIRDAFAEHYPLSFEDWENGFRNDDNPAQQIAVWLYAADAYKAFSGNELCERRRADVYKCLLACMGADSKTVWDVYQPEAITRAEAEKVVGAYFMITPLDRTDQDARAT